MTIQCKRPQCCIPQRCTVRASTMVEKGRDYVLAARLIGLPHSRILLSHILPNVMGPVMVIATINLALAIIRYRDKCPREQCHTRNDTG